MTFALGIGTAAKPLRSERKRSEAMERVWRGTVDSPTAKPERPELLAENWIALPAFVMTALIFLETVRGVYIR